MESQGARDLEKKEEKYPMMLMDEPKGDKPTFSLITASLNSKKDLAVTIQSLLSQKSQDFEFILVDGLSSDGTPDAAAAAASKFVYPPKITVEKDEGIYYAFNKGLRQVIGEYICFLGCGDKLVPDALDTVQAKIKEEPGADVYYGILKKYDDGGGFTVYSSSPENLLNCSMIPHQASFIRRETYRSLGGFSQEYRIASDFEVMLRIFLNKGKFVFIDQILAEFKLGGISTRDSDGYYECIKILKKYNCIGEGEYRKKALKKIFRDALRRLL